MAIVLGYEPGDKIEPLFRHEDERGFLVELFRLENDPGRFNRFSSASFRDFLKTLDGFYGQCHQITMFSVNPGQKRAGHKHPLTNEKWIFVRGQGMARLEYPSGERLVIEMNADDGLFVIDLPAGVGHEVENTDMDEPLWCVYWADRLYDPDDLDVEPWEWEE